MKRSVAIIGTRGYPSYYGGFETLIRELAPYLAENDWDVSVYGRPGSTNDLDPTRDPRVRSVVTRGVESKSLSTLSFGLTSTAHAVRSKPDVALVMNVANGFWLPMLKARKIPTVVNVDGIEWEREKWGARAKQVFVMGAKLTARYGNTLVYDSKEIARRWSRDFGRDGDFIPYGGRTPILSGPVEGLQSGGYALMVARFVPENTVVEFIEAAKVLSAKWHVVIVGSTGYGGALDDMVQKLADSSERVHWFGHVSDDAKLFALWSHAGAYFHGHSVGGTNPALVQAMACGAPTVARDTTYNREVLGETARFVQPDAHSIAKELDALLSDKVDQSRLSAQALERASQHYTWSGVCGDYEQTMLDAIERGSAKQMERVSAQS